MNGAKQAVYRKKSLSGLTGLKRTDMMESDPHVKLLMGSERS